MYYCDYCCYRNSWDCDDGWNRRKNCGDFKLDFDTLTDEQKKLVRNAIWNILSKDDEDYGYW